MNIYIVINVFEELNRPRYFSIKRNPFSDPDDQLMHFSTWCKTFQKEQTFFIKNLTTFEKHSRKAIFKLRY